MRRPKFDAQVKMRKTLQSLKSRFSNFCETTTIHGLRYVGDDGTSLMSRLIWFVVVIVSFVYAGLNIYNSAEGKAGNVHLQHFDYKDVLVMCSVVSVASLIWNFDSWVTAKHSVTQGGQTMDDTAFCIKESLLESNSKNS